MRKIPSAAVLLLALAAALAVPAGAAASDVRPFVQGSLKEITAARRGKPFMLGLWSLTCTHCQEELALFARMLVKYPGLDLVLVSTDTPDDAATLTTTLTRHGLARAESWVFADGFAERLRFEIDPRWGGELPRTYLYAADHSARAVSGRLDPQQLEPWIQRHFPGAVRSGR